MYESILKKLAQINSSQIKVMAHLTKMSQEAPIEKHVEDLRSLCRQYAEQSNLKDSAKKELLSGVESKLDEVLQKSQKLSDSNKRSLSLALLNLMRDSEINKGDSFSLFGNDMAVLNVDSKLNDILSVLDSQQEPEQLQPADLIEIKEEF